MPVLVKPCQTMKLLLKELQMVECFTNRGALDVLCSLPFKELYQLLCWGHFGLSPMC